LGDAAMELPPASRPAASMASKGRHRRFRSPPPQPSPSARASTSARRRHDSLPQQHRVPLRSHAFSRQSPQRPEPLSSSSPSTTKGAATCSKNAATLRTARGSAVDMTPSSTRATEHHPVQRDTPRGLLPQFSRYGLVRHKPRRTALPAAMPRGTALRGPPPAQRRVRQNLLLRNHPSRRPPARSHFTRLATASKPALRPTTTPSSKAQAR